MYLYIVVHIMGPGNSSLVRGHLQTYTPRVYRFLYRPRFFWDCVVA